MVFRDLFLIILVDFLAIMGIVLNWKKESSRKCRCIFLFPLLSSAVHFLISNFNVFMCLVYFSAILEIVLIFLHRKKVLTCIIVYNETRRQGYIVLRERRDLYAGDF